MTFENLLNKYLQDPEFKEEWEKLQDDKERDSVESEEASEDSVELEEDFENPEGKEIPSAPTEDNAGIANLINALIKDEWDAIDGYQSAIMNIKSFSNDTDSIKVLEEIANDEYAHVGNLQKILNRFAPQASTIADGEEEAEETIAMNESLSKKKPLLEWVEIPIARGGAYSSSRFLNKMYRSSRENTIALSEGVSFEPEANKKGGIITFSTVVNALELDKNKLINFIKQKVVTINNKLKANKKVDDIAQNYDLAGWTVGHYLNGRYTAANGAVFDEKSLSVEIIGIDSNTLLQIAEDLCAAFTQESVLVKDYNTNKIFFADVL